MNLAALLLSVATGSIGTVGAIYMMILKLHVRIDDRTGELKTALVENKGELKNLNFRVTTLESINQEERTEISGLKLAIAQIPSCGAARKQRTRRADPSEPEI